MWGKKKDGKHGWLSFGKWREADRYDGNVGTLGWDMNPDDGADFDEEGNFMCEKGEKLSQRRFQADRFGSDSKEGGRNPLSDSPRSVGIDDDEFLDLFQVEDDDFSDLEITVPDSSDLAAARKLANHLSVGDDYVLSHDKTCEDCVFWVPGGGHTSRGWCCGIWYWVQVRHGGSIQDREPDDHRLCSRFKEGTGEAVTCYDCRFWDKDKLDVPRSEGCMCWNRFLSDEELLHEEIRKRFGSAVGFSVFQMDKPFIQGDVCFDFERDCDLEPGYGKRKAEEAKRHAESSRMAKLHTYVAGIAFENRQSEWLLASAQGEFDLALERDPENEYDPNAVKVLVNGRMGGFIPADLVQDVARVMDGGGQASIVEHEVTTKRKNGRVNVNVKLTLQLDGPAATFDDGDFDDDAFMPDRTLPEDTYYVNDDLIDAVKGPRDTMMDTIKKKCR